MDINIGFIGYSDARFDVDLAKAIIDDVFDEIEAKYGNRGVINIISGATDLGVPGLVYAAARDRALAGHGHLKLIGVMCKDGYNYKMFPCDVVYAVGDSWGDESQTFLGMIDVLYKIGGGEQSVNEFARAKASKQIVCREFEL